MAKKRKKAAKKKKTTKKQAAPRKARGRYPELIGRHKTPKARKTAAKKKAAKKKRSSKKGKRGMRYSAKQQAGLVDKYHELRKGGLPADKAAKRVGVSYITLLKWEKASGKRIKTKRGRPAGKKNISKKTALKKALKVPKKQRGRPPKTATKGEGHTLVTPTGFRIEGISTSELIRVLRELK